ncbi:MAG TPA: methyltransferase domain-containing protein [Myxococcales bacterium]|nr:methyltransferase domain-containing protein [Myxococcales bacterium]
MQLVCPACRKLSERGLELFTVEPAEPGLLRCRGCARTYPVIDGIPVLLRELSRADHFGLLAALGPPAALAALGSAGPDDTALPHMLDQLSTYLETWREGFDELAARLRALPRVGSALELGCGTGRALFELSRTAASVVGLDRSGSSLRAAQRLLRGEELPFARRMAGRSYAPAAARAPAAAANVELVCGDALEPPFAPGAFDRVVALNVLDNVSSPRALLQQMGELAAREMVVCSPFAWRDGIVDEPERLPGPDPAASLRQSVTEMGWKIDDEVDLPWSLRRDARAVTTYQVHWLRARR